MKKTSDIRTAQRASSFGEWLEAKSETGSFLMGEDGPVSRKEVLMVNAIILLLIIIACVADGALWLTALCMICCGVLVKRLNKEDEKNHINWNSYDRTYDRYD